MLALVSVDVGHLLLVSLVNGTTAGCWWVLLLLALVSVDVGHLLLVSLALSSHLVADLAATLVVVAMLFF